MQISITDDNGVVFAIHKFNDDFVIQDTWLFV